MTASILPLKLTSPNGETYEIRLTAKKLALVRTSGRREHEVIKHGLSGKVDENSLTIRQLVAGWTGRVTSGEFDGHN